MPNPGGTNKTIGDLVPDVIEALQQRTDVANICPKYIKKSLLEITHNNPFEELKRLGPLYVLTVGQAIYPVSFFLNPADDYDFMDSFVIYLNPPTNTQTYALDYKTPKAIESMIAQVTQGTPRYWSRYGINFHFGPVPNQAYTIFARYQVKHPFPLDDAALSGAPIYIPPSWEEIVTYSAALRIAIVKRWNDQKKELHETLFGDPDFVASEGKRGRPGLINARTFQQERDEAFNSRSLGITIGRYTAR